MRQAELAEFIWGVIGPSYTGWPNVDERVDWAYRDQYAAARDRCELLAKKILERMKED